MVTAHAQSWVVGGPLWPAVTSKDALDRPALIRLEGDSFMDDLQALLAVDAPARATELQGRQVKDEGAVARLFQPAHGHYTVVLASLVCVLPGRPEHAIGPRDTVAFVVRRILVNASSEPIEEQAWIPTPTPAGAQMAGSWQKVSSPEQVFRTKGEGLEEELHPLFPVMWASGGRMRRAWSGVLPVSARERYEGGADPIVPPTTGAPQLWQQELDTRFFKVIEGLKQANTHNQARKPAEREDLVPIEEAATRFALLDLAELLSAHFEERWIDGTGDASAVSAVLDAAKIENTNGGVSSVRTAAAAALAHRVELLEYEKWQGAPRYNLRLLADSDGLRAELIKALSPLLPDETTTPPASPSSGSSARSYYVIRCVYWRPPCGVRPTELVSKRSAPFRMAGFLDLDAPHRPTRISLPDDLSFKSLRDLKKSVGIVMSAAMRKKTEAAATMDIAEGKTNPTSGIGFGWITIWSIPIITICAIVLLMIIATLLHLVFWWLPFLKITIPIPAAEEMPPQ